MAGIYLAIHPTGKVWVAVEDGNDCWIAFGARSQQVQKKAAGYGGKKAREKASGGYSVFRLQSAVAINDNGGRAARLLALGAYYVATVPLGWPHGGEMGDGMEAQALYCLIHREVEGGNKALAKGFREFLVRAAHAGKGYAWAKKSQWDRLFGSQQYGSEADRLLCSLEYVEVEGTDAAADQVIAPPSNADSKPEMLGTGMLAW
ncbi:MAG: hypothetical protein ACK4NQ_04275 [Fimbriimonadaceae bacterium]